MIIKCKLFYKNLISFNFCFFSLFISFSEDQNLHTIYSHYPVSNRQQISSINVSTTEELPTYGTRLEHFHHCLLSIEFVFFLKLIRTSTVILVRHDQTGVFVEKNLQNPLLNSHDWNINTWHFTLNNANEPPILIN